MGEQTPLARYVADANGFALHVMESPGLADYVDSLMITVERLRFATNLADRLALRDAASALATVAYAEGFWDTAAVFEQLYQSTCQSLLIAWAEGN